MPCEAQRRGIRARNPVDQHLEIELFEAPVEHCEKELAVEPMLSDPGAMQRTASVRHVTVQHYASHQRSVLFQPKCRRVVRPRLAADLLGHPVGYTLAVAGN